MRQHRKRYLAAAAHPKGVRREATIIRSTTSRRSGTSTQALLIQRFEATRGTGHGAGSRPQYNGGSTGRHGSKATHALSSQQAVKPTKPPPVQSTGGSLARRRPARPNHACVTPAAMKLRMQRFSEGNLIGTSVQRCPTVLSCTKQATFLFPEPHSAVGSEFHLGRTRDRDSDDVAPEGQRFCVSPRGNGFPEATFEGHRCLEEQRFCVAPRGNGFAFPQGETVFRRRHSRDTVAPRGNGFALPRGATVFRRRHSRDTVAPRGNGFELPRGATVFRRRHSRDTVATVYRRSDRV